MGGREERAIDPTTAWTEVARTGTRDEAGDLSFVLDAVGIPSATVLSQDAWLLVAPAQHAERARSEIARYLGENRGPVHGTARAVVWPLAPAVEAALVYAIVMLTVFLAERHGSYGFDWRQAGFASAAAIRAGAWWRAVTALFLHADALHLAGNVIFGGLFGVMLAQSVGAGGAWLVFLLAGGLGNAANAWLQSPSHGSIGASTGVFALLGAQVVFDWMRRRESDHGVLRRWAPIAIGVALLAWLGGGGRHVEPTDALRQLPDFDVALEKVDVGAHLLGFAAGALLGGLAGRTEGGPFRSVRSQVVLGGIVAATILLTWALALTR